MPNRICANGIVAEYDNVDLIDWLWSGPTPPVEERGCGGGCLAPDSRSDPGRKGDPNSPGAALSELETGMGMQLSFARTDRSWLAKEVLISPKAGCAPDARGWRSVEQTLTR